MKVLGIDPGSRYIGFALLEGHKNHIKVEATGVLKFAHIEDFLTRLREIFLGSRELIQKFSPDEVAVESLIFKKNPSTLIKLAQARGAILSAILESYQGKIFEYPPNLIKAATAGYGHADKREIARSLDFVIGKRSYQTHDESDAAAVAICHLAHREKASFMIEGVLTPWKSSSSSKGLKSSLQHLISPQKDKRN